MSEFLHVTMFYQLQSTVIQSYSFQRLDECKDELQQKRHWPILRHYLGIYLEGMGEKNTRITEIRTRDLLMREIEASF
jgi:hypothetical protein